MEKKILCGACFLSRQQKTLVFFFSFLFKRQIDGETGQAEPRGRNAEEPASLHCEVIVINGGRRHISTNKWLQETKKKREEKMGKTKRPADEQRKLLDLFFFFF